MSQLFPHRRSRRVRLRCPSGDLADISYQAVTVGTVGAVETFQEIQIFQVTAVKEDEICADRFRNSIDRETYRLMLAQAKSVNEARQKTATRGYNPVPSAFSRCHRTTSTEQWAYMATDSETLPSSRRSRPCRP